MHHSRPGLAFSDLLEPGTNPLREFTERPLSDVRRGFVDRPRPDRQRAMHLHDAVGLRDLRPSRERCGDHAELATLTVLEPVEEPIDDRSIDMNAAEVRELDTTLHRQEPPAMTEFLRNATVAEHQEPRV